MKCGDCGNTSPALSGFPKHVFCRYYLLHMSNNADASRCEHFEPKPKTIGDSIRTMTDEELAERIAALMACMDCPLLEKCNRENPRRCIDMWIKWLKSPVEEGQ